MQNKKNNVTMKPGSLNVLSDDQLARFVIGQQKKTKFQLKKEQRELKAKQAEEEAAKIYESFVESFQDDDAEQGKSFVRGQTISIGQNMQLPPSVAPTSSTASVAANSNVKKEKSDSPFVWPGRKEQPKKRKLSSVFRFEVPQKTSTTATPEQTPKGKITLKRPKKVSEMDKMLEEIKQKDEIRKQRQSISKGNSTSNSNSNDLDMEDVADDYSYVATGSLDAGDPSSTNLYVGNLAPTVTEELLEEEFGAYGKIYSVKIMWPRTEEEKLRKRNCGFVSFFDRMAADEARDQLHNKIFDGQAIVVGWGKAVKIDPVLQLNAMKSNASGTSAIKPVVSTGSKWDAVPSPPAPPMSNVTPKEKIYVEIPKDRKKMELINRLARYVSKDGACFEKEILEREKDNPDYKFMYEQRSPDALYYRWKVYSLSMGDKERRWNTEESEMFLNSGFIWVPPPALPASPPSSPSHYSSKRKRQDDKYNETSSNSKYMTGQQLQRARDKKKGRERSRLSTTSYNDWLSLLDEVASMSREPIKKAMGFALDHCADCSVDLCEIVMSQLHHHLSDASSSPQNCKLGALIGLLYLVSDLLHNSSAPVKNASRFRTFFYEQLPFLLFSMRPLLHHPTQPLGRMTKQTLTNKVLSVLKAWEEWSLFPPRFLLGLNATFLYKPLYQDLTDSKHDEMDKEGSKLEDLKRECRQSGIYYDLKYPPTASKHYEKLLELLEKYEKEQQLLNPTSINNTIINCINNKPEADTEVVSSPSLAEVSAIKQTGSFVVENEDQVEISTNEMSLVDLKVDGLPLEDGDLDNLVIIHLDNTEKKGHEMEDEDLDGVPM